MGNHLSCMSSASAHRLRHQQVVSSNPRSSNSDFISILPYDGGFVAQLEGPLTAAEVMMESPGLFLCCHSLVLSQAGRILAIPADEELCAGNLYILLPMHKLNARFSSEELAYFSGLASNQQLEAPLSLRSFSEKSELGFEAACGEHGYGILEGSAGVLPPSDAAPPKGITMCRSRSWMPNLETITEASYSAAF